MNKPYHGDLGTWEFINVENDEYDPAAAACPLAKEEIEKFLGTRQKLSGRASCSCGYHLASEAKSG